MNEASLPGLRAPAQKEAYCAPLEEGTDGSRDEESRHQLAVCLNCPLDTAPRSET